MTHVALAILFVLGTATLGLSRRREAPSALLVASLAAAMVVIQYAIGLPR